MMSELTIGIAVYALASHLVLANLIQDRLVKNLTYITSIATAVVAMVLLLKSIGE